MNPITTPFRINRDGTCFHGKALCNTCHLDGTENLAGKTAPGGDKIAPGNVASKAPPRPDFIKAYMHNGYFKSLKEVVHFYNTRDKLPRCQQRAPREKVTGWPAPEVTQNMDTTFGNLGLTSDQRPARRVPESINRRILALTEQEIK